MSGRTGPGKSVYTSSHGISLLNLGCFKELPEEVSRGSEE